MSRLLENITVEFFQRQKINGHPFTDIRHEWDEGGVHRNAWSRVWWVVHDTPHARASEIEAFKRRQTS